MSDELKWTDELPAGWETRRLAYLGEFLKGRGIARADITGNGVPAILYGDIYTQYDVKTDRLVKYTTPEVAQASEPIQYGDLLLTGSGETKEDIGKCVAYLGKERAYAGGDVIILRQDQVDSLFLSYVLNSSPSVAQKIQMGKGDIIVHIYSSNLRNLVFALPPLSTQRRIASYLDEETARIDALVKAKQEMLALLEKKRAALVSQAVTKGLDPKVKMKDNGIEWLGVIPEHWEMRPLRYWGWCQNGVSQGGDYFGSGHPFVNYGDVYKNEALPETVEGLANSTEEDQLLYSVQEGDVFFTRTSETIEEIGIASTCLKTIEQGTFSGFVIRVRPFKQSLDPRFTKYYFRSSALRVFFMQEMNIITRASMSQDLLKRLPVLVPPPEEQAEIIDYLEQQTSDMRSLSEELISSIELLGRRRAALITAAVTGQVGLPEVVRA